MFLGISSEIPRCHKKRYSKTYIERYFNLPVSILNIFKISLADYKEKLGYLHKISEDKNLTELV